jgi:hypothetical protein
MTALLMTASFHAPPSPCWTIICYGAALFLQTAWVFAEQAEPMKWGAGR